MQDDDPLQARCPECHTVFAVTAEVLEAAGGKVRCGQCLAVFDAREHLLEQASESTTLTETKADNGKAEIPDTAPLPLPDIPFELQDDIAAQATGPDRSTWLWGGGILLMVLLLAGQWLWFERNRLADDPRWRSWIERFCSITGCRLAPPLDPQQIRILSRSVSEHLGRSNALLVHITMVNTGPAMQRWPVLELKLSNARQFTAMRRFRADEYLPAQVRAEGFRPRTPVQITLELRKPTQPVTDFEITFR